jgi:hypothetical protein
MKPRGARNSPRPCGQARGPPHGPIFLFFFFNGGCPLPKPMTPTLG